MYTGRIRFVCDIGMTGGGVIGMSIFMVHSSSRGRLIRKRVDKNGCIGVQAHRISRAL